MNEDSITDIEEVKKEIIDMRGRLPTKEEMRITRLYVETLWFLRGDPQEEITEELLLYQSEACVSLTKQIGNGNPIKAAENHYYSNRRIQKRIEASTSDVSTISH